MKKLFIITLSFAALHTGLHAQTRPQQSIYQFNAAFLNPAAIGAEDYGQVQTGFRRQWVGIDGAPATYWISGSMRLASRDQSQETSSFSKGHGLGFSVYNDKIGPYSTINLNVGYAYHLPLSSSLVLSGGFWGGVQHTRYDVSKSIYPDQPVDPAVAAQASALKKYTPDLSVGMMLLAEKFFAGASVHQLVPSSFIDATNSQSKYKTQWQAAAGYRFNIDEEGTGIWLSGIVKSDFTNPVRYDINAKLRFQELFWLGTSYRKDDAFGAGLGLNITRNLSFGYMYEWGIDKHISSYSKGSHELCVGFRFLKEKQSNAPKLGW